MRESICQKPDKDVAGLICGHPLPCPWHTVVIHADKTPPTVEVPATATPQVNRQTLEQLKDIARAIEEDAKAEGRET